MIIGTLFTLFVLPAIYLLIARDHNKAESPDGPEKLMRELELEAVGS